MKTSILSGPLALLIAALAVCVIPVRASSIAWTNTAGGNWSAPANWNPNQLPGLSDDALITNSGTYLVTMDVSPSINSLTLGGGSGQQRLTNAGNSLTLASASVVRTNGVVDFDGNNFLSSGALTISGILNLQGVYWTPQGGATLTPGGALNIQNNVELYGALTNQGTVTWQGGYFRIWNNGTTQTGVVWNQTNGLWDIQCDQPMYAGDGGEQFHNSGLVLKISGLGTTTIYDYLDNTGTMEAQSGTIQLDGNSNLRGRFVAAASAAIDLAGNYTNGPDTSLTGAGSFALNGGTLTLLTNVIANLNLDGGSVFLDPTFQQGAISNLTLQGADLGGTNTLIGNLTMNNGSINGSLTVLSGGVLNGTSLYLDGTVEIGGNGMFNWAGGQLDTASSLVVGSGGTLNISSSVSLLSSMTNQGTVNWLFGYVNVYNDGMTETGAIWNQVGGVWNIDLNGGYSIIARNGPEQFHNAGLLRQTAGGNTSYLQIFLDNTGTVEAQSGAIQMSGGSDLGGTFLAETGAAIDFGGLSYTNFAALNLTGSGSFTFDSGTLTLLTNPIPNLQLTGGTVLLGPSFQGGTITNLTLDGSVLGGTNTVTGTLNLTGGGTTGACTVASNGTLNIQGGTLYIEGLVTNLGTVNWTGGYIYVVNNGGAPDSGEVWNQPGAFWNMQCDQTISVYYGTEQFNNAGTLLKNTTAGITYFDLYLNNSGTMEAQTGTIQLQDGSNLGGGFLASSAAAITFGNVSYSNNVPVNLGGAGSFQFNGGTITLFTNPIPNLQLTGGTVLLAPSFQGGTITNLTLDGSTLGGTNTVTGTLNLNGGATTGPLTIAPDGALNIQGGTLYIESLLTNLGAVNWTGGYISVLNNAGAPYSGEIWNQPGAFWNMQCDQTISIYFGTEQFNNAGTLLKNTTVGITYFDLYLNNSGTMEAQTGTIQLQDGSYLGGNFVADSGGTIGLGAAYNLSSTVIYSNTTPVNFGGAGSTQFNGGTFTLFTNPVPNLQLTGGTVLLDPSFQGGTITNLTLTGSTLGGTNTVTGVFDWAGGTLGPGSILTVAPGGTLNIQGAFLDLQGLLTNQGTVNWESGNNIRLYNSSGLPGASDVWNQPGAVWNALCDAYLYYNNGTEEFHNAGAFRKSASLGTTYIQLIFDNVGLLDAQSGQIYFNGQPYTLETAGTLNVGINGLLDYGQIYLPGTSPLTGAFSANFNNGYAPDVGDSFTPLTYAAAQTGAFTGLNLPSNDSWQTSYSSTFFTMTVLQGLEMTPIPTQYVQGSTAFAVTAAVADSEVPPDSLTYSLVSPPGGMSIGPASGVISWTPPNIASTNTIVVNVTDNGAPALHASTNFTLVVVPTHVNLPPVLPVIPTNFVNEQTLIRITNTAAEADTYATLAYTLVSAPAGAAIDANGIVTWTPSQTQSPSTNLVIVAATNTDLYVSGNPHLGVASSFYVVVHEVNVAPELPVILAQTINELTPLRVTNTATEENIHATLAYGLVNAPAGMTINSSGVIAWTPAQTQSPGTNLIVTVVTNTDPFDTVNPHLTATNSFVVVVDEVNVAPVLPVISTRNVNELALLSVNDAATDSNIHATLSYSLVNPPAGMMINSSGLISWTPAQTQSPGAYVITNVATSTDAFDTVNPNLTATNTFTVNVIEVNVAPALPVIPSTNINELTFLSINDAATESNIHSTITGYGLINNPPAGASINSSGLFTWTPSQAESSNAYVITVVATNSDSLDTVHPVLTATNMFTVNVIEVNVAPVLPVIPSTNINELTLLSVTNAAVESDIHATLAYGLVNPPAGMTINSSGVITWTPGQNQSPGTNLITTIVTNTDAADLVNPHLTATNSFTVVVHEVNVAPVLPAIPAATNINELTLLMLTNTATESNLHATLAYSQYNAPAGMSISTNGIITWTPSQTQSPGAYVITNVVTSSDALDTVNPSLSATNRITVNVIEQNVAPVLPAISTQAVNELTLLTVTNTATESNIHATLAYGLINPPAGMTINSSGVVTWTPGQAQSPGSYVITNIVTNTDTLDLVNPHLTATNSFTVNVIEVNVAPTLTAPFTTTNINELTLLTVTNSAADSDIHATLSYALISPPAGANISTNGIFTWTPAQTQSPGTNLITVAAISTDLSDLRDPVVASLNTFTVIVHEVNVAPVLPAIPTQTVNDLVLLTVTNTAAESNIHATLAYTLVTPPAGMTINSSGVITWTPNSAQGPATNTITTVVTNTDAFDPVNPHYYATNTFLVIVYAPVLAPIGNTNVNVGQTVAFTASATDNDPTRTLSYSLVGPPANAAIGASTGNFTWRPGVANANTTNTIVVEVSDNSIPQLTAAQSFKVAVNPLTPVNLGAITRTGTQAQIQVVSGSVGPDYILQASSSLTLGSWIPILTNTPGSLPFNLADTNASLFNQRFYQIRLAP